MTGSPSTARVGILAAKTRVGRAAAYIAVGALYVGAGKLGLALAYVNASTSVFWPPTGIALAALLLLGSRVWPAILVGAFVVNLTTAGSVATSASIAVGNTLEAFVGAFLVNRFAGGAFVFDRPRTIVRFVFLAGGLATTISATLGVTTLTVAGYARAEDFRRIWTTWWLGDATGALIFTPPLVLWILRPPLRWARWSLVEAGALVATLGITAMVVFRGLVPAPLTFVCLPFPLWAAFRFGQRGGATATMLLSVVAVWATLGGYGPFANPSYSDALASLQIFMGVLSVLILVVGAVVAQGRRVERELSTARDELEVRVAARTEALSRAARAQEHEVAVRQQAERELRRSEMRLRGLLEAAPDPMVIVDDKGGIVQLNAQAEKVFGFDRQELLGQPVELLVPKDFRSTHGDHRSVYSSDPRTRPMGAGLELHAVKRDGTEFPVEISLSPLRTDEGLLVIAAIRDTTERRTMDRRIRRMNAELEVRVRERTAELEQSNEALRQFAYAASHDLQEPLRTVANYAQILAGRYQGRLDADADVFIGFIVDGAEWMHELLQGLLAYSRVDARPVRVAPTAMDAALDLALEHLAAAIAETSARIERAPLPVAIADHVQMVQLFQNLIGNAIKFRRDGVIPEIHVQAIPRHREWLFSVEDNGIGVDPRHGERIFAIFQRLHSREEYPGTGVGLAICKKIIERHGGRIWVESRRDSGSRFLFTLPRAVTESM